MRRVDRFRQTGAQHSAEKADEDYQNSREHGASHWQYISILAPKKKPPPPESVGASTLSGWEKTTGPAFLARLERQSQGHLQHAGRTARIRRRDLAELRISKRSVGPCGG